MMSWYVWRYELKHFQYRRAHIYSGLLLISHFPQITFNEIDVEGEEDRCWDKISIFRKDGSMIRNPICNEREPAVPYISKGGASIHFETDRSGDFRGFKLTYQMVRNFVMIPYPYDYLISCVYRFLTQHCNQTVGLITFWRGPDQSNLCTTQTIIHRFCIVNGCCNPPRTTG